MIGIIDYGMGNLHSVKNGLARLGIDHFVSNNISELEEADGYILPGVGSFKDAMTILNENGMTTFIRQVANGGKPILGICLGMQLLFESSEENGLTEGLCLLPGQVVKFPGDGYKVPHMGWNELHIHQVESPLMAGLTIHQKESPSMNGDGGYVYFVHSYFAKTEKADVLIATTDYHEIVPAVVGKDNVYGAQFHPEKSSEVGMQILRNFGKLVEGGYKFE